MEKLKRYSQTFFSPKAIVESFNTFEKFINDNPEIATGAGESEPNLKIRFGNLKIYKGSTEYNHDSEAEFFADYRKDPYRASFTKYIGDASFSIHFYNSGTDVEVKCSSRQAIETAFNCIEDFAEASKLPEAPPPQKEIPKPKIFIGHGHSPLWRELKDHLTDKHKYDVIAYEVGSPAGHTIRDILEDMLNRTSMAFLVLTGEDKDESGNLHARENVIHETGLFQGRLGFSRAIAVL